MIEIIWEVVVKEDAVGQFELAYGPGGAWSRMFARHAGFRGTTLLHDTRNPRRYLTIDLWDTEAQRERVLAEHKTEYDELDAAMAKWIEAETELGVFRVMAEGTVRPRGAAWRGRRRTNH